MGVSVRPATPVFMTSNSANVYKVTTEDGYEIKATDWHEFYTNRGKIKLSELRTGDNLLIQSGKGQFGELGDKDLGILIGLITDTRHFINYDSDQHTDTIALWGNNRSIVNKLTTYIDKLIKRITEHSDIDKNYEVSIISTQEINLLIVRSSLLTNILESIDINKVNKLYIPNVIWCGTEDCVKGYLSSLFHSDGVINIDYAEQRCYLMMTSTQFESLKDVQKLLSNFGIFCRLIKHYEGTATVIYKLIIESEPLDIFMNSIGFLTDEKNKKYFDWKKDINNSQKFEYVSPVSSIEYVGKEPVFDTTQVDHNSVIFGGIVTGNCDDTKDKVSNDRNFLLNKRKY